MFLRNDRKLCAWPLDELAPRVLANTDGIVCFGLSPDGEPVAYATTEALWRVPVEGGEPRRLAELSDPVR